MSPTTTLPTLPPLAANIFRPSQTPKGIAIISPPYPPLGGSHHDAVVQSVARGIVETQQLLVIAFSLPRPTSWKGEKEVDALGQVLRYGLKVLREEHGVQVGEVVLIGYSYGALVTMRVEVPDDARVRRVLISPPLGTVGFGLMLRSVPSRMEGRGLVVYGDRDNWTSKTAFKSWAEKLGEGWIGVEVLGSHFYDQGTDRLVEVINEWLSERDPPQQI